MQGPDHRRSPRASPGATTISTSALSEISTPAEALRDRARAIAAVLSEAELGERKIIDAEDVLSAISTWKSMLTPPEEAQHLEEPLFEEIYRQFERIRHRENLVTFDDQIYDAVRLLDREDAVKDRLVNRLEHIILDEFQDVNHARLRLAKLLAGSRAKVMVVGDDDQCIYEWQGARSSFIKRGFQTEFTHHPHTTYKLTRSFRFGPHIAQVAANVIGHNTDRVDKELVANEILMGGQVTLDAADEGGGVHQAIPCLRRLISEGARPSSIVVLVRKYSQANLLQSLLLARGVPFFVEDQGPLGDVFAVQLGLSYLDAACGLDEPLTDERARAIAHIVNRPQRYVKRETFDTLLQRYRSRSLAELLTDSASLREAGLTPGAVGHLRTLESVLRAAKDGVQGDVWLAAERAAPVPHNAGRALEILLERVPFEEIFLGYKGTRAAEDDVGLLRALSVLLREANVALAVARRYIESLDPRRGRPDSDCIRITSVFKAKGLEWDHVLLPDIVEGQTPDLRAVVNVCVNRHHPGRTPDPTQTLESERRLFYVAVTRARRSLHLFADADDRRLLSRFVHEACIEATVDAVSALQEIAQHGESRESIARLERGARKDARLREGLLKMLRRVAQELPAARSAAIGMATLAVNRISAAPFTYPHAYPDAPAPKGPTPDTDTGLPF